MNLAIKVKELELMYIEEKLTLDELCISIVRTTIDECREIIQSQKIPMPEEKTGGDIL